MAEVLLSHLYDKTTFKTTSKAISKAKPTINQQKNDGIIECHVLKEVKFLHGKPEDTAHIRKAFSKCQIRNQFDNIRRYYLAMTCDAEYIYTHDARIGITDVYDHSGQYKASMAHNLTHKFQGYELARRSIYRTWNKMIMTPKFIYATDNTTIYKMIKHSALYDNVNTVYDHREYAPYYTAYCEDSGNGITDIAAHGENIFFKVKWYSLTDYLCDSALIKYHLGQINKIAVLNDYLYVTRYIPCKKAARQVKQSPFIDRYNISELVPWQDTANVNPPMRAGAVDVVYQKPQLSFKTTTDDIYQLVPHQDKLFVVCETVIYIYDLNGVLLNIYKVDNPIANFCPVSNGFLISHCTDITLYV